MSCDKLNRANNDDAYVCYLFTTTSVISDMHNHNLWEVC